LILAQTPGLIFQINYIVIHINITDFSLPSVLVWAFLSENIEKWLYLAENKWVNTHGYEISTAT